MAKQPFPADEQKTVTSPKDRLKPTPVERPVEFDPDKYIDPKEVRPKIYPAVDKTLFSKRPPKTPPLPPKAALKK